MQKMIPTLTQRQRYWLEHIQACEASGKSMVEYAATQGFPVQALYASKNILIKKGVLAGAGIGSQPWKSVADWVSQRCTGGLCWRSECWIVTNHIKRCR
ncbi:MAG: hypothetical protein L3J24_11940 [Xanthomonadales bacterium]|nr:hypothetical protein [Xanthomonadales bacterium]